MKSAARFLVLAAVLYFAFILPSKISAQPAEDYDLSKPNQNWQCLEAKRTGGHSVELSTKTANQFPPPGSSVYIVECVSTAQGSKCTTGQCDADTQLVGNCNDLTFLQNNYRYSRVRFSGSQPATSSIDGKVGPFEWESATLPDTGHTFFGVGVNQILSTEGQWPTLQLGTFYFPNSSESCAESSMRWDPYGRIFDSVSLEPIPATSVVLLSKINGITSQVSLPGLENPQSTDADGIFNFVVPDGTYILNPVKSTHSYPNVESKLNPNYSRAYYDIYRGEDIIQQGFIQHRDIPMDPVSTPFTSPVKILDYSVTLDKLNSRLLIAGSASHPLSKISVYSGTAFIKQVTSNKFGIFRINLDNSTLDQSQLLRLEADKTDLANPQASLNNKFLAYVFRPVFAQNRQDSISFSPIMNNLEGYAFDDSGNTVPHATIGIYLTSSDKSFYETKSDSIGFFSIPSQYLPPLSYYLRITTPDGNTFTQDTVNFASNNARYAAAASANYGVYRPQTPGTVRYAGVINESEALPDGSITKTVIGPEGKVITVTEPEGLIGRETEAGQISTFEEESVTGSPDEEENTTLKTSNNNKLMTVFLILIFGSLIIAFYIYQKNKPKPAFPPKKTK